MVEYVLPQLQEQLQSERMDAKARARQQAELKAIGAMG